MKKIISISFFTLSVIIVNAQAYFTQVDYNKLKAPAVVNEIPYEPKTATQALEDKMKNMGYKSKSSKGFDVYRGVKIAELGADTYDLYFTVEKKSKKEKDRSVITMLVSKGYDNFIGEVQEPVLMTNAKNFLTNLIGNAQAVDLNKQIEEQEENVRKAEKAYNKSTDEGIDLEKRKKKIEENIEENKREQAARQTEITNQKNQLEALKAKRKI